MNKTKSGDLSGRNAADLLPSVGKQLLISGRSVPVVSVLGQKAPVRPAVATKRTGVSRAASTRSAEVTTAPATAPALSLAARRSEDDQPQLPVVPVVVVVALLVATSARRALRVAAGRR